MTKNKIKFQTVDRPQGELMNLLAEHLEVLQTHCAQYDLGKKYYAAEIALNLRVLLSDTPKSENRSLLHQLKWESKDFVDTAKSMNDGDPNCSFQPAGGLAFTITHNQAGQLVEDWEPNMAMLAKKPLLSTRYSNWWEEPIIHSNSGTVFPRRRIIRQVANQDRGGHVAQELEKSYYELTRNADFGFAASLLEGQDISDLNADIEPALIKNVVRTGAGTKIVRALVRQIAHEVLLTLLDNPTSYVASIPPTPKSITPIYLVQFMNKMPNGRVNS